MLFKNKKTWEIIIGVGVIMAVVAFCLLGALLSPAENTKNLPIALVNSDQGAAAGLQKANFGAEITERLLKQANPALQWTVLDSRENAVQAVRENKYYAAIVIPADYSASLLALVAQTGSQPARVEILSSQAAPAMGSAIAQSATQNILANISKATGEQLTKKVQEAKIPLNLPAAMLLDNPVQIINTPVATVGEHSARGSALVFLSLLLSVCGLISAILPGFVLRSNSSETEKTNPWHLFGNQLVLYGLTALGAVTGLLLMAYALNLDVADWTSLTLFGILSAITISALVLAFQLTLGRAALPLGILLLVVLGMASSGGMYPGESLPLFWQWLNAFLPMRYILDGLRSILFLNSELNTGLGNALVVLSGYLIGALALAAVVVYFKTNHSVAQKEKQLLQSVTTVQ